MSGVLFVRITVAGLSAALVVGCGQAESRSAGDAGPEPANVATVAPNPAPSISAPPNATTPEPVPPNVAVPNPKPPAAGLKETRVAWVPPGPDPPILTLSETAAQWSAAFHNRDCNAIAELGPKRGQQKLYAGLGDACRAVLNKDKDDRLWASAEAALGDVRTPKDCLDRLARGLLRDLVMAHRRAPDADIQIEDAEEPERWPCDSDDTSPPPATSITPTSADLPPPSAPTR